MARLYRCNHPDCETTEFEADQPVCPECRTDGTDPKFQHVISPLVLIHFDPVAPHPGGKPISSIRQGIRACDGKPIGTGGVKHAATNNPSVVNCKKCRATLAWQAEVSSDEDEGTVPGNLDYPVEIRKDPKHGTVVAPVEEPKMPARPAHMPEPGQGLRPDQIG